MSNDKVWVGLVLLLISLDFETDTIRDWIPPAIGVFLIITGIVDSIRVKKNSNNSKDSREK